VRSILSLPPVLQELWSRVYASVIASPHNANAKRSDAEEQAWEAVRRANGGEMPGEPAIPEASAPSEPTDEEMVEALAPIVADACGWGASNRIERAKRMLRAPVVEYHYIVDACVASWKAARAWGRK